MGIYDAVAAALPAAISGLRSPATPQTLPLTAFVAPQVSPLAGQVMGIPNLTNAQNAYRQTANLMQGVLENRAQQANAQQQLAMEEQAQQRAAQNQQQQMAAQQQNQLMDVMRLGMAAKQQEQQKAESDLRMYSIDTRDGLIDRRTGRLWPGTQPTPQAVKDLLLNVPREMVNPQTGEHRMLPFSDALTQNWLTPDGFAHQQTFAEQQKMNKATLQHQATTEYISAEHLALARKTAEDNTEMRDLREQVAAYKAASTTWIHPQTGKTMLVPTAQDIPAAKALGFEPPNIGLSLYQTGQRASANGKLAKLVSSDTIITYLEKHDANLKLLPIEDKSAIAQFVQQEAGAILEANPSWQNSTEGMQAAVDSALPLGLQKYREAKRDRAGEAVPDVTNPSAVAAPSGSFGWEGLVGALPGVPTGAMSWPVTR